MADTQSEVVRDYNGNILTDEDDIIRMQEQAYDDYLAEQGAKHQEFFLWFDRLLEESPEELELEVGERAKEAGITLDLFIDHIISKKIPQSICEDF